MIAVKSKTPTRLTNSNKCWKFPPYPSLYRLKLTFPCLRENHSRLLEKNRNFSLIKRASLLFITKTQKLSDTILVPKEKRPSLRWCGPLLSVFQLNGTAWKQVPWKTRGVQKLVKESNEKHVTQMSYKYLFYISYASHEDTSPFLWRSFNFRDFQILHTAQIIYKLNYKVLGYFYFSISLKILCIFYMTPKTYNDLYIKILLWFKWFLLISIKIINLYNKKQIDKNK